MPNMAIEITDNNDALEKSMVDIAAAMSDTSRVKILCALMDGRAWTATELSIVANIAPSTTSAHLSRLIKQNLITYLSQGRHRYYRLAGKEIAALIETIMGISWKQVPPPQRHIPLSLKNARTCYDHLAGEVAVEIYDFMLNEMWLHSDGLTITHKGREQLHKLGVVLDPKTQRKACYPCLDWSERRFHLAGDAGAALLILCEQKGWLCRVPGFREVNITSKGKQAFRRWFAID